MEFLQSLLNFFHRTLVYINISQTGSHNCHQKHQPVKHHHLYTPVMMMNQKYAPNVPNARKGVHQSSIRNRRL